MGFVDETAGYTPFSFIYIYISVYLFMFSLVFFSGSYHCVSSVFPCWSRKRLLRNVLFSDKSVGLTDEGYQIAGWHDGKTHCLGMYLLVFDVLQQKIL